MTKKRRPAVKQDKLFEWFSNWLAERLFQSVELPVTFFLLTKSLKCP